jgi:deoxyribonuclease-2
MRAVVLLLTLWCTCNSEARTKPNDQPLQCLDENGKPVDWFVVMKFPRISKSSDPLIKTGEGFVSMTSLDDDDWKMSKVAVGDNSAAAGRTMAPVYEDNDFLYIMYNDQPPEGEESGTLGHTKGSVVFDGTSGFWLVHSAPRYVPEQKSGYSYPTTATRYGQTMLCLTLNKDNADKLGEVLRYAHINVYDSSKGSSAISESVPLLAARTERPRGRIPNNPAYHVLNITYGATEVKAFGKSRHFNADLYHQLLAPTLQTDLFANTWQSARDPLPSNCTEWSVDNVDDLIIPGTTETYSSNLDHSKWAISQQKAKPWVCIGGINRTKFQLQRGGESVCVRNKGLWTAFNGLIAKTEGCPIDGEYSAATEAPTTKKTRRNSKTKKVADAA